MHNISELLFGLWCFSFEALWSQCHLPGFFSDSVYNCAWYICTVKHTNSTQSILILLPAGAWICVGLAALHPGAAKSSAPAVAARPWRTPGPSPGHTAGGKTCPPGGAGATQRPPEPAGQLLASQRKSLCLFYTFESSVVAFLRYTEIYLWCQNIRFPHIYSVYAI